MDGVTAAESAGGRPILGLAHLLLSVECVFSES